MLRWLGLGMGGRRRGMIYTKRQIFSQVYALSVVQCSRFSHVVIWGARLTLRARRSQLRRALVGCALEEVVDDVLRVLLVHRLGGSGGGRLVLGRRSGGRMGRSVHGRMGGRTGGRMGECMPRGVCRGMCGHMRGLGSRGLRSVRLLRMLLSAVLQLRIDPCLQVGCGQRLGSPVVPGRPWRGRQMRLVQGLLVQCRARCWCRPGRVVLMLGWSWGRRVEGRERWSAHHTAVI